MNYFKYSVNIVFLLGIVSILYSGGNISKSTQKKVIQQVDKFKNAQYKLMWEYCESKQEIQREWYLNDINSKERFYIGNLQCKMLLDLLISMYPDGIKSFDGLFIYISRGIFMPICYNIVNEEILYLNNFNYLGVDADGCLVTSPNKGVIFFVENEYFGLTLPYPYVPEEKCLRLLKSQFLRGSPREHQLDDILKKKHLLRVYPTLDKRYIVQAYLDNGHECLFDLHQMKAVDDKFSPKLENSTVNDLGVFCIDLNEHVLQDSKHGFFRICEENKHGVNFCKVHLKGKLFSDIMLKNICRLDSRFYFDEKNNTLYAALFSVDPMNQLVLAKINKSIYEVLITIDNVRNIRKLNDKIPDKENLFLMIEYINGKTQVLNMIRNDPKIINFFFLKGNKSTQNGLSIDAERYLYFPIDLGKNLYFIKNLYDVNIMFQD